MLGLVIICLGLDLLILATNLVINQANIVGLHNEYRYLSGFLYFIYLLFIHSFIHSFIVIIYCK